MIKLTLAIIATLAVANVPAFAAETCLTPGFVKIEGSNACHRDVASYLNASTGEGRTNGDVPQNPNAEIDYRADVNGDIRGFVEVTDPASALFDGVRF